MTTIVRTYTFEAAHYLPHVPDGHKCARLHGHSYTVRVGVRGEVGESGMVMDFAEIDRVCRPVVDGLDHRLLNDFVANPTSELLSEWMAEQFGLDGLGFVEVSETPRSCARWEP